MIIHENDLIEEEIDGYRVLRKSESGGGSPSAAFSGK